MMAEELFIGKLDPMKVKAAIYQTKFWPKYSRDKVYTHGTSHGTTRSTSSTTGGSDTTSASLSAASSQAYFYDDWFSMPQLSGTRTETNSTGSASMNGSSQSWAESLSDSDSSSESDAVADVPIFIPVPFQELSSIQYFSLEEQLHQMTAALKEQFPRHCFIKIQGQDTQPLLVPVIDQPYTSEENLLWYRSWQMQQQSALPVAEVDRLLIDQETKFLEGPGQIIDITPEEQEPEAQQPQPPAADRKSKRPKKNLFDDLLGNE
jgi:hypothetical protein